MDHIFSPWRMKYMSETGDTQDCIFCSLPQCQDDRAGLIVFRGKQAYVLLNRYPYTSGHLMVASFAHQPALELLDASVRQEIIELTTQAMQVLKLVYTPEGFNIGANIGSAAGAGFAGHVHFHIVPRWGGDTNFMSTLGQARVLPEDLDTTWERVHTAWNKYPQR